MERYLIKIKERVESTSTFTCNNNPPKQSRIEIELPDLLADPGLRPPITNYGPNIRERVRRAYLLKGPCQPRNHDFPRRDLSGFLRRFNPSWFGEFESWLEYSLSKDAIFCLYCYLFKPKIGDQGGGNSFVGEGFTNWKRKDKLKIHEGGINSAHHQALEKGLDLMNQKQHVKTVLSKQSDEAKRDYRFLTKQNEVLRTLALKKASENLKLTSPDIQKDICNAIAAETTNAIIIELGDGLFSILLDEYRDVSMKEQMAVALRYVDKSGCAIERFLGIKHVSSTSALSLENALEDLLSTHDLSISGLRGQGYDGASNIKGEFNGLKTLILRENEQRTTSILATSFTLISNIVNVVGASCKCCDILREKQAAKVIEALSNNEIISGRGLNQERSIVRASDTRWGSHHGTLLSMVNMFSMVIDVFDVVVEDGSTSEQKSEAFRLLKKMQSFEFVYSLHLMSSILGITNELSQALQRKDQDIVNAMRLVQVSKDRLQLMRDSGWDSLMEEVITFCGKNSIDVPSMDDTYICQGRSRRRAQAMTNLHHYRVELLYTVIDMQLLELNSRFNEVNTELLLCVACLNPCDSFASFDKERLIRFAKFYPKDFSDVELWALPNQLENFIMDVRSSGDYSNLKEIGDLTKKMVKTRRHIGYSLVYRLLTLAFVLPVATATEREHLCYEDCEE